MSQYEDHMTKEMLDVIVDPEVFMEEYRMCKAKAKQVNATWVSLPAVAASGKPVTHGARLYALTFRDYWEDRANLAFRKLSYNNQRKLELEEEQHKGDV